MSNTMFAIWIGLSAGILLLFLYAAFLNLRRNQSPGPELGNLMGSFLPVDMEVLSDLINPAQQRLLQETCWPRRIIEDLPATGQPDHRMFAPHVTQCRLAATGWLCPIAERQRVDRFTGAANGGCRRPCPALYVYGIDNSAGPEFPAGAAVVFSRQHWGRS